MRLASLALALSCLLLSGCPTIPGEAPELSAQLGSRLTAMEGAHRRLLGSFFTEKRRRADDFVQQVWAPAFTTNLLAEPAMAAAWEKVSKEGTAEDRREFLRRVGVVTQQKIAAKRLELIQPLDELEDALAIRLRAEYDQMRAINSTLTAFLQSAAKVDANRKRYLEMVGVTDEKVTQYLSAADSAVATLLGGAEAAQATVEAAEQQTNDFARRIRELIATVNP